MSQHLRMAQMGEMISMIAHQWRQPLATIASSVIDLKIKSELSIFDLSKVDDAKNYESYVNDKLEDINALVENLTNTINDFRNFYIPDKKKVKATTDEILARTFGIIGSSYDTNGIEMELIQLNKKYIPIDIYDNELIQVILNILKNAQDNFTDKKIDKPKIKILVTMNSIVICDNGGGIPEDILEKIFEPYFSTKDEKNGTGLGLYMSKIIVEEHHNGSLEVFNKDNGACFKIKLGNIE